MARPKRPFEVVAGDTLPHLLLHVYADTVQSDGTRLRQPQDITGYQFNLYMERPAPAAPLVLTRLPPPVAAGRPPPPPAASHHRLPVQPLHGAARARRRPGQGR